MLRPEHLAALSHKLREQSGLTPEREALLERLAREIQSGEYAVDVDKLADQLLSEIHKPRINTDEHR
jgi:anti-sigma28 factor (negative regulator of flagellin synthesis)